MHALWHRRPFLTALASTLAAPVLRAQSTWPQQPLQLVVPLAGGSSSDIIARQLAPQLAQRLGQPVQVVNVPGDGSSRGTLKVVKSAPNGYTLLLSNAAGLSVAPHWVRPSPYQPLHHLEHLALIGTMPTALLVPGSLPLDDFASLLAWMHKQPGRIPFGSVGTASVGHVVGMQLAHSLQLPLDHVPYPTLAALRKDLIAAKIVLGIDALSPNLPLIVGGQLKAAAITTADRAAQAPYIPCIAELGYPALVGDNFLGLSGPAGLPDAATQALVAALHSACAEPALQQLIEQQGFTTRPSSPGAFTKLVAEQFKAWGKLAATTRPR